METGRSMGTLNRKSRRSLQKNGKLYEEIYSQLIELQDERFKGPFVVNNEDFIFMMDRNDQGHLVPESAKIYRKRYK